MNLTVRIHDIEYKANIAQGITFSEEYNETLDSGAVRISHIPQIKNLKPYDDVYIYESGDGDDYFDKHIALWRQGGGLHDGDEEGIPFYRHLLVDRFSEDVINLSQGIYSYAIELFSETKGLETIQLPNISVTQPLNISKKIDIYTYLVRFTKLYSPKYKTIARKSSNENAWTYTQKYTVAPELESIFGGVYCQDFTLSNPTFRDLLSTLMVTLDMIPYVKDNVIYAKAISERTGSFDMETEKNEGRVSKIVGQMSSDDYCDGVRRQYTDALSSDGICHFVEYLGFRNKNEALMTLTNMGIETTHKIYKVKKFNLCYYRDVATYDTDNNIISGKSIILCKQDMLPLVKLEQEWQILSQDWRELEKAPKTVEELSKYKLSTVYYSIGGNTIKGWGTHYQIYDESFALPIEYDITKTYVENIVEALDRENRLGRLGTGGLTFEDYKEYYSNRHPNKTLAYIAPLGGGLSAIQNVYAEEGFSGDAPLKYKTIFFEIEYDGFYDGAIIHTRDNGNDNIYQNDNVSSSLTLLEKDGVAQKEKLNRFANKTHVINGRLDGENYSVSKLLKLGNTCKIGNDDDVIIYRREYSIYNNYIIVSYAGIQDYVLKNFYTSVYARYRTNQLMSYGESVNRAETKKVILLLSKNKKYMDEKTFFSIKEGSNDIEIKEFFSAFVSSKENKNLKSALVTIGEDKNKSFFVDLMSFYSGNIMCFNIAMPDNASGGNFISSWVSPYEILYSNPSENPNYFVGSEQEWYNIVDDDETGSIKYMSFEAFSENKNLPLLSDVNNSEEYNKDIAVINSLKELPKATSLTRGETIISLSTDIDEIYKDNKDKIDMTLQVEPISDSPNDIVIGSYLIKLSNLLIDDSIKKIESQTETDIWDFTKEDVSISVGHFISPGGNKLWIATPEHDDVLDKFLSTMPESNIVGFDAIIDCSEFAFSGATFHFEATGIYWKNQNKNSVRVLIGNGYYKRAYDNDLTYITELECPFHDYSSFADKDIPLPYKKGYIYQLGSQQMLKEFDTFSVNAKCTTTILEKVQSSILEKNMFVEFSNKTIDKNIAYKILPYTTSLDRFSPVSPKDVFNVTNADDGDNNYKIHIDLKDIPSETKSICYWYFDFDSAYKKNYGNGKETYISTFNQSGYRFVFGVNVTPEDIERGYIDIYITKTTNRDERVFDNVGRQIGVIHNCVSKEGNYVPPTQQAYDIKDRYSDMFADIWGRLHTPNESQEVAQGNITGLGTYLIGENAEIGFKQGYFPFWYWQDDTSTTKHYVDIPKIPVTKKSVGIEVYTRIGAPEITEAYAVGTGSSTGVWNYTFTVSISHKNGIKTKAVYSVFDIDGNAIVSDYEKTLSAETSTDTVTLVSGDIPKLKRWYVKAKLISGNWGESDEAIKYITE